MAWWEKEVFQNKYEVLRLRQECMRGVRDFFDMQGYQEVETPILQVMPCADVHIHGFATELMGVDLEVREKLYLQTSPEFDMKKLLVAGMEKIYQICKVFRNGEDTRLHNAEFTMLEWYRSGGDYSDLMDDVTGLVRYLCTRVDKKRLVWQDSECNPFAQYWEKISVPVAFEEMAGIDLMALLDDRDGLLKAVRGIGLHAADDDSWDDLFFRVMGERIEPKLGFEAPCILYDYPARMACLARKKESDPRLAERFEVFVCGVELANGFSELTDAAEQRARFEADMAEKKALYGYDYPLDEEFLAALEHGMPESCGIALGLDRLVMLMTGSKEIDQVLWTRKV